MVVLSFLFLRLVLILQIFYELNTKGCGNGLNFYKLINTWQKHDICIVLYLLFIVKGEEKQLTLNLNVVISDVISNILYRYSGSNLVDRLPLFNWFWVSNQVWVWIWV